MTDRSRSAEPKVISIQSDVEHTHRYVETFESCNSLCQPPGQRNTASWYTNQRYIACARGLFEDLMGDSVDDSTDISRFENRLTLRGGIGRGHRRRWVAQGGTSFPASPDGSLKDAKRPPA